jgi:hypothetical protein
MNHGDDPDKILFTLKAKSLREMKKIAKILMLPTFGSDRPLPSNFTL